MKRNLGRTTLRRRRRTGAPMDAFDTLPAPLRRWLCDAALPWSPASARRIWTKSLAKGRTPDEALETLSRAEARTLARDKHAILLEHEAHI
ncbi:DUF6525 family protein [Jannaschia sp. CCS1]|uniref:DUF6525 family protein n=1 Tax=Jannaschia sp. (strain CCS1) TaxID=290400 RepID=UPI00006C0036|nr:DUF6525 family protein [Jannaschia sp. CCS1]ABD55169.1 hypothetical protein Jann_2252 [Jannaschia sp. CCS1]